MTEITKNMKAGYQGKKDSTKQGLRRSTLIRDQRAIVRLP